MSKSLWMGNPPAIILSENYDKCPSLLQSEQCACGNTPKLGPQTNHSLLDEASLATLCCVETAAEEVIRVKSALMLNALNKMRMRF